MRRVLVVAYHFPPLGGAGVQRTLKFVKYLPEFGWQPLVLTARPTEAYPRDSSLETEIPSDVSVRRTSALLFPAWVPWRVKKLVARWLLMVDPQLGWLPFAVRTGQELIRQEKAEAIYTTAPPYTTHLAGLRLKKATGRPWIADFRDPWVGNFSLTFPTPLHKRVASHLEQLVIDAADQVIVISEPMRRMLLDSYPKLHPSQIGVIPNGYDLADFDGVKPVGKNADRLTIVYTGSFYGQRQVPDYFLRATQRALSRGWIPHDRVQISFVGNMSEDVQGQVEELGLADVTNIRGYVLHRQSIGYLLGADLLLLIIGSGPNSETVLTGKIFEYLAAGKPILALVPPGAAADLVQEAQAGAVVAPEDVEAIARQMKLFYQEWTEGELRINEDCKVIARYDRRRLAGRLAKMLSNVSSEESEVVAAVKR